MLSLSPNSCGKYFRLGSTTRRYSVIGCPGYECANPSFSPVIETAEIGVGTCDENNMVVCAICLDSINLNTSQKNTATTECGHTFCLSCLLKNLHLSNLCPLCREPVEKNVKHVLKPLSFPEGIQLLNHELEGLEIYNDVERYVQNALEVSTQPNTSGENVQDVIDGVVNMVTNFGFNLLYDAVLHTNGGEEQRMDQEWIVNMYNYNSGGDSDDDSTINDYNNSDSDSEDSYDDDSSNGSTVVDESNNGSNNEPKSQTTVMLPEVPESMLE